MKARRNARLKGGRVLPNFSFSGTVIAMFRRALGSSNWAKVAAVGQGVLFAVAFVVLLAPLVTGAPEGSLQSTGPGVGEASQAAVSRAIELLVLAALVHLGAHTILIPTVLGRMSSPLLERAVLYSASRVSWLLLGGSLFVAITLGNHWAGTSTPFAWTLLSLSALCGAGNAIGALAQAVYQNRVLRAASHSYLAAVRRETKRFGLLSSGPGALDGDSKGRVAALGSALDSELDAYKASPAHEVAREGIEAFHHSAFRALEFGEFKTTDSSAGRIIELLRKYLTPTRMARYWSRDPVVELAMDGIFDLATRAAGLPVQSARREALGRVRDLGLALTDVQSRSIEGPQGPNELPRAPIGHHYLGRWFTRLSLLSQTLAVSPAAPELAHGLVDCASAVTRASSSRSAASTALRRFPEWAREFARLRDPRGRLPSVCAVRSVLLDLVEIWREVLQWPWHDRQFVDHLELGRAVSQGLRQVLQEDHLDPDCDPLSLAEEVLGPPSRLWEVLARLDQLQAAHDQRRSATPAAYESFVELAGFCMNQRRRIKQLYEMTVADGVLAGTMVLTPRVWSDTWRRDDESGLAARSLPSLHEVESQAEAAFWSYTSDGLGLVAGRVIAGRDVLPPLLTCSGVFIAFTPPHLQAANSARVPEDVWRRVIEIARSASTPPIAEEPWLVHVWSSLSYFAIWAAEFASQPGVGRELLRCAEAWIGANGLTREHLFDSEKQLSAVSRALEIYFQAVTTTEWRHARVEKIREKLFSQDVRRVGLAMMP